MKAKLIAINGDESRLYIKNIAKIKSIICQNKYESEFEVLFLSDNKIMIYDADCVAKGLNVNVKATEIAHDEELIFPSMNIAGDVLIMDYEDAFYQYIQ